MYQSCYRFSFHFLPHVRNYHNRNINIFIEITLASDSLPSSPASLAQRDNYRAAKGCCFVRVRATDHDEIGTDGHRDVFFRRLRGRRQSCCGRWHRPSTRELTLTPAVLSARGMALRAEHEFTIQHAIYCLLWIFFARVICSFPFLVPSPMLKGVASNA